LLKQLGPKAGTSALIRRLPIIITTDSHSLFDQNCTGSIDQALDSDKDPAFAVTSTQIPTMVTSRVRPVVRIKIVVSDPLHRFMGWSF
jgi:hypothetical protein